VQEVEDEDDDVPSSKKNTRVWKPQVHYVWDILLDDLLPAEGIGKEPKGSFREFWRIVVDGRLSSSWVLAYLLIERHRVLVCCFSIQLSQILGLRDRPKSATAYTRGADSHAFHEEFHAYVDEPPGSKRPVPPQICQADRACFLHLGFIPS
jgi:hypothetical protein